ncbi:MAG: glycosyltransferase family 2 protein [Verrucomicrobiota bacterium]
MSLREFHIEIILSMVSPTIALCIPAYNAVDFLPRLLESARQQDPPFDEIIVCVDASPDATADVAKAFGVTVIVNETNQGCSASKNRALQAATSDWIHFHDADDVLLPNFTKLASNWAGKQDCPDVVLFDYEYRDNTTNELIDASNFLPEELENDPIRYAILHQINPFCGLYRRSKLMELGGYDTDPEILYNEDVAFHCKLALAGMTFGVEKERSIINYRIAGSMSQANQRKCMLAHCAVMRRVAAVVGSTYPSEIASRFWAAATILATVSDWTAMDRALEDARKVNQGVPTNQSREFAKLCRLLGVKLAFRFREHSIRLLKPQLRNTK